MPAFSVYFATLGQAKVYAVTAENVGISVV